MISFDEIYEHCRNEYQHGLEQKMTARQGIDVIKVAIAEVEWEYPMDYAAAFDMAIEALEKQIPKPVDHKVKLGDWKSFCRCGKLLFNSGMYCIHCGQAIDWSDENGYDNH